MSGPEVSWLGKCTIQKSEPKLEYSMGKAVLQYIEKENDRHKLLRLKLRVLKLPKVYIDYAVNYLTKSGMLTYAYDGTSSDFMWDGIKIVSVPSTAQTQKTTVPLDGTVENRIQ